MKTLILPNKNMCDYIVGKAQVTVNNLGKCVIEPVGNKKKFKKGGVILVGNYVHFGLWKSESSQHI